MNTLRVLSVEKKLGSGLYAEVYLANDKVLDRKVALKIIRQEFAQQDSVAVSHAKTLSALQRNANLVQIFSVGEVKLEGLLTGSFTVIEMEWINGENLSTKMKGLRFTVPECRKICLGIQNGISHMHAEGIAHGDLHPGNILLDNDSNAFVIDAANRHNATAFRTTYANIADLFEQDLQSLKFCMRLAVMHTMMSPTSATELMQRIESATSVQELRELCETEINWGGNQSDTVVGTVSGGSSIMVVQLLENEQLLTLREAALESVNRLATAVIDENFVPMNSNIDRESLNARIEYFERVSTNAASMLGLIAAWGDSEIHERIELDSLRLLRAQLNAPYMKGVYKSDWGTMRKYPALIMFYACCFAAYRNGRFSFIRKLVDSPSEPRKSLLDEMNITTIELEVAWREIGKVERYTPVSDRIVSLLPGIVPSFALSDQITADDFDELQAFLSCVLIDQSYPGTLEKSEAEHASRDCGLKGRFLWRFERSFHTREIESFLLSQAKREGVHWGPIRNGFFGGNLERAIQVIEFSKAVHNRLRQAYRMY